ncbi:MAG: TolC family protein [Calditrichia bacterium]|nr:TolC family protein [Calditrichia bacterium]
MKRIITIALIITTLINISFAQKQFTLKECVKFAVANNPTLKNAWYDMKMAENSKLAGYSGWLPTISGQSYASKSESGPTSYLAGEYVGEGFPGLDSVRTTNNFAYSASLNWNLLDVGVSYYNIKKAKTDYQGKVAGYQNQLQQTILSIVEKYYDLVKQQKLLTAKNRAVERSEEQDRRAKTMYELGATAKVDMLRAKVNLGNDKMAFLQQKNALENAKHQLNLAMGREPLTPINVSDELRPTLSMEDVSKLKEQLEISNPSLKNLKLALTSSNYNKKISFGSMLPNVAFFARWSRNVPNMDGMFKDFDREYNHSYGLSLNVNLFNGFRDHVNHQNAKIAEKMAQENFRQQKQQLLSQLKYYYNQFNTFKEIRETNLLNIQAAQEEYKLADERFKIGSGTSLELRDAQVRLSDAEQLLIESDYQLVLTKNQIQALLGRLKK